MGSRPYICLKKQNIPVGSYTGRLSPNEKTCLSNLLCYNLMLFLFAGNGI